jgi:hypothetical protein
MQNLKSNEKIPLFKISKKNIDYGKQVKIEEDINGIFNKLNSNNNQNKTENNLNFERENLNNNIKEENKIKEKEECSLNSYEFKNNNSFNSKEFESHKSTVIEKSINFENIINIEVNNLNENLTKNENGVYNDDSSLENKFNKEYFKKKNNNNNKFKENCITDTSINRNDGTTQNILSINNNNINDKGKNLHIIKKYNIEKINNEKTNEKDITNKNKEKIKCNQWFFIKKFCIIFICVIIIFIIIIQILIFLNYL